MALKLLVYTIFVYLLNTFNIETCVITSGFVAVGIASSMIESIVFEDIGEHVDRLADDILWYKKMGAFYALYTYVLLGRYFRKEVYLNVVKAVHLIHWRRI